MCFSRTACLNVKMEISMHNKLYIYSHPSAGLMFVGLTPDTNAWATGMGKADLVTVRVALADAPRKLLTVSPTV